MRLWMTLGVLAAGSLSGCFNCTLVGCSDAVTVELDSLPSTEGTYTIELTGDASASCSFDVDAAGVAGETSGDCYGLLDQGWVSFEVGRGDYDVSLSDADGELDAASIDEADAELNYPNGKRCGPECWSALVVLDPVGGIGG